MGNTELNLVSEATLFDSLSSIPLCYETDSFWTEKQRKGNSIHEISYRACFKSELPEYFIKRFTKRGEVVLDPFMGRGTTAVQAALMGRIAYSSDINPLCSMLARPRLNPPNLSAVSERLKEILVSHKEIKRDEPLLTFFHPDTLRQITSLRHWLAERSVQGKFDSVDEWIRMVAINRLTGHSPGFFSVRTMPPNQAVSVERQKQINLKNKQQPTPKDVAGIIMKKTKSLLRSGLPKQTGQRHKIADCAADRLDYVEDGSVSLVVTSPPFLDIVNYKQDNWMRCWFADIKADALAIDHHRTLHGWGRFVRACFRELARVVKSGGYVAFEVGEVRNGQVLLEEQVVQSVGSLPFELVKVMINQQKFTKTSNCWGITNNAKGVTTNRIVLFKRR